MQNDDTLLEKRFSELSSRSISRSCYTYTDFLTMAEQDILLRLKAAPEPNLIGGYPLAERKIACFGNMEICGYEEVPPIVCIKAQPLSQKFADTISHRDVLGSIMSESIRRDVIGDIIIHENCAFIFCIDKIADYIITEFNKIKHTDIKCSIIDSLPDLNISLPEISEIVISSERIDAVVAAVYKLSRGESQKLFEQKKVFVNNRVCENLTYNLNLNDRVSVRGYGKFIYEGIARETKKGKLRALVRIF